MSTNYLRKKVAEEVGFEPTVRDTTVFKTAALSRSASSVITSIEDYQLIDRARTMSRKLTHSMLNQVRSTSYIGSEGFWNTYIPISSLMIFQNGNNRSTNCQPGTIQG